jgi:hypothetical protein
MALLLRTYLLHVSVFFCPCLATMSYVTAANSQTEEASPTYQSAPFQPEVFEGSILSLPPAQAPDANALPRLRTHNQ